MLIFFYGFQSQVRVVLRCAATLAFIWAFTATTTAQSGRAELTGDVRDPSGAAVAGAGVIAVEDATRYRTTTLTNAAGGYAFVALRPGVYSIVVEASGFARAERQNVQLITGERVRADVTLAVGASEDAVVIESDASPLRTESGGRGQVIENRQIVTLPLNGRNFVSLVGLSSGVALPPGSSLPRINGGRPRTNEFLFDGVSVLQPEPGQVAFFPIIEAIQEFKVETNSPSAEFGRFNGGVVNLTTKSGANEFHGAAFFFLRNEALNARNLFAPRTPDQPNKPVFRRSQSGFVLGGPVRRDQTFFFIDYQGTRQRVGRVRISTVPTLLQRRGIFTEPVNGRVPTVFDPATTRQLPTGGFTRTPFAGNQIPLDRFDPVARRLLDRFPLPNAPGTANNFRRVTDETQIQDQFDVRLDHRFSERDRIFARFSYALDDSRPAAPLPDGSGVIATGTTGAATTDARALAGAYTRTFGLTTSLDVRFGYTRRAVARRGIALEAAPSEALGLAGLPQNAAFNATLPTFAIDGVQQIGPAANVNADFRTDVTQLAPILAMQRGNHVIKIGADYRFSRLDIVQPPSPTGLFRFTSLFTDLPGAPNTGVALASFLLGQTQSFSIDLQQKALRPRAKTLEAFIQDDWKATPRLTLNAGLRSTLNFPSTEVDNQGAIFNLETQRLEFLGRDGFPKTARRLERRNFGPRVGLAYRLKENLVVRAGYGLIWIEQAGITTPFTIPQFPFVQTATQRSLDNLTPAFALSAGPQVAPVGLTPDAGVGQGVFGVDRNVGSGYAQQWSLTVQRTFGRDVSLEVAYAGSKITRLGVPDVNLNQLTAAQLASGQTLLQRVPNPFFGEIPRASSLGDPTIPRGQLLRPFPRYTTVSLFRNNVGGSSYHALQMKLEKRLSGGLSFLASYTRSKLIDDASSVFDASLLTGPVANFPVADSFNRRLERDVSNGDIPNAFAASFVYELPIGRGRRFNPSGVIGAALRGWEVSGVVSVQSGLPLAVAQATNFNAFAGFGVQRPNRVSDPNLPSDRRGVAQFFDVNAFAPTPQFAIGTSSRNPVRGPSFRSTDLAFVRRIAFGEVRAVEFRTEIFNLTNTPPLAAPNVTFGTAGFGSITAAGDPRVVQLALKLRF
jgi:hypothetical protein